MAIGAIGFGNSEPRVPRHRRGVAAKTQITHSLGFQHVTVGGAVSLVADGTSFDKRRFVLKGKGAAFIGMAFKTGFVFKRAEPYPHYFSMRIVA
jgi:hypothetical protein